jgi:hypothetical protein
LPRSFRIPPWARISTNNFKPASTAAFFVRAPLLRMACRINRSSISMLVRVLDLDV